MERLTRASGDEAFVVAGANALNYVANGMLPQIWGMNVVLSNDVTSGKLLVMDINAVMLFMRDNIQIEMSEHDDTNFQSNLVTIRAELRAAFAVFNALGIRYGDLTV
jgi:HK97 family phage major capsid protein